MYLHKQKNPNGDVYLTIREKFHVLGKGSRERIVEVAGYVSILKRKYDDPIAFFTQRAKELTLAKSKAAVSSITIDPNEEMTAGTGDTLNVGYGILKQLCPLLEL